VKTLGEIAIEAGLVNRASAARAGRMAEERKEPLIAVLVHELGVDEVALIGALRKQTRVPLIDPASIEIDPEALRQVPRDMCARLRVLPLSMATDGSGKVLRLAMADPTDSAAVAEIEQLTHCDVEVSALPLSAIDELVDKGYRQVNTAVVSRGNPGASKFVTSHGRIIPEAESEVSETAQIPFAVLLSTGPDDVEARLSALISVLVAKGVVSQAELVEALKKLKP
jgi:hypothetical protein